MNCAQQENNMLAVLLFDSTEKQEHSQGQEQAHHPQRGKEYHVQYTLCM